MKKSVSYIFILLSGICWGCIGLSNRMLTQMGMGLGNRVFVRNFGTLVVLTVVFGLLHREVFRIKLRHLPIFLGSGLVSILLLSIVYFQCQTLCSLSVAAILLYLAPSFVVLISAVLWKTPLTGRKLAALGISLVGCVLVSGVLGGGRYGLPAGHRPGGGLGTVLCQLHGVRPLRHDPLQQLHHDLLDLFGGRAGVGAFGGLFGLGADFAAA